MTTSPLPIISPISSTALNIKNQYLKERTIDHLKSKIKNLKIGRKWDGAIGAFGVFGAIGANQHFWRIWRICRVI